MSDLRADIAALNRVTRQETARRVVKRARFKRVNDRRADLIFDSGISPDDPELAELQAVVFRVIDLAFPKSEPPDLEAIERRLAGVQPCPE